MYKDDNLKDFDMICGNCVSVLHTCMTCINNGKCEFNESNIQIPKTTEQVTTLPNGQQIIQQTYNPERIRVTCGNCTCSNNKEPCNRQSKTCGKWRLSVKP
jgi:hypothetical protein